ncbi:MAG: hypothetical protein CFK52_05250 [Chloracidobacterium sp. CP2_5A]|nr:MAG: hypothetical protein CFK52_05250 [Chloracidobacterium sp. CP2_5A]
MTPEREIWRGPVLGQQRERLLEDVRARLQQGRPQSALYLVASRPMLDAISRRLLDGRTATGSLGGLPVYLFNGFIRQLLRTARVERDGRWQPASRRRDISGEDYPLRRPLIAQIMRQLAQRGDLSAFGSLAAASGCVASVTKLIGEIARAGKTAAEFAQIVDQRINRFRESLPAPNLTGAQAPHPAEQAHGYERDVARIAQCYAAALEIGAFTEGDADYLRAIAALDGKLDGFPCQTPLLEGVERIIVDGFFDFTPVQGEILRRLIGRAPRVTFNFDDDLENPQVFAPVRETIEKVRAMGEGFAEVIFHERGGAAAIASHPTAPGLDILRAGLFNPAFSPPPGALPPVFVSQAPDLERELRHIAKAIKRYIQVNGLTPSDIAIVVRDKETYGPHLRRALADEEIAYTLDERLPVADIPAVRAWLKLLAAALDRPTGEASADDAPRIPVSRLLDVIKSDYFALPASEALDSQASPSGQMLADDVENVVAFVGDELRLDAWLERAERLAGYLRATAEEAEEAEEAEDQTADEEVPAEDELRAERPPRPSARPDAVTASQLAAVSKLLKRLGQLLGDIPLQAPAAELAQAIERTLAELAFETRLEANIRAAVAEPRRLLQATADLRGLQAARRAALAAIDAQAIAAQSIAATLGAPTTAASATGEAKAPSAMALATLHADILRALDGLTLRIEPEVFGAVRVLEATAIRGLHFPVIFVPGLAEGGFPARLPGDWIYPAAERERLKEDGLTLEDISPATLAKEEHYFYQVACRATQALHLSYAAVGAEDKELAASSFLAEIARLAPETRPGGQRYALVPKGYDGSQLLASTTKRELVRQVVAAVGRQRRGIPEKKLLTAGEAADADRQLPPLEQLSAAQDYVARQGWQTDALNQRLAMEQARHGRRWTPFDGQLAAEDLRATLALRFNDEHVFSATALNEYATCPFRFFARRVLRLQPRVTAALDLQAQDRGRLLHDILRDAYRDATHDATQSRQGDPLQRKLDRLRQVAAAVFEQRERQLPPLNPRLWDIEKRVLTGQLERLIAEEAAESFQPINHITEIAFGMRPPKADQGSVKAPLTLTNKQGEKLRLRGQIDRVDVLEIQDKDEKIKIFIAYDYKLSRGYSLQDMRNGRDVQIAVYITAIQKCFPSFSPIAGGGYYSIRKAPRRNNGIYQADYIKVLPVKSRSLLLEKTEWESNLNLIINYLWKYRNQIREGKFQVFPSQGVKDCKNCDFKSICRFEVYRIYQKNRSKIEF